MIEHGRKEINTDELIAYSARLYAPETIELLAQFGHEANRAYCLSLGDTSQLPWDAAPEWQKKSARDGVQGVLAGNGPEESHISWLEGKRAEGWTYGEVKDPDAKTHPCFVPYAELPPAQKVKDHLYVQSIALMCQAIWAQMYPAEPPPTVPLDIANTCDGTEQDAFEAWATAERYDMSQHPLHWLFLDDRTYAARQGWRAGIEHTRTRLLASQEAAAHPTGAPQ